MHYSGFWHTGSPFKSGKQTIGVWQSELVPHSSPDCPSPPPPPVPSATQTGLLLSKTQEKPVWQLNPSQGSFAEPQAAAVKAIPEIKRNILKCRGMVSPSMVDEAEF
jgi:hypothetical protein